MPLDLEKRHILTMGSSHDLSVVAKKEEKLADWFRQNIAAAKLIKWYRTKIVQHSNWFDYFEDTVEEKEAGRTPKPTTVFT